MTTNDYGIDQGLLLEFIDESEEALAQLPARFVELEREPENLEIIQSIFRPVHSLKGNAAYFGLLKTKTLAHDLETILDKIRSKQLSINKTVINILLAGIDELQAILKRAGKQEDEIVNQDSFNSLLDRIHSLDESISAGNVTILTSAGRELENLKQILGQSTPEAIEQISRIQKLLESAAGTTQGASGKSEDCKKALRTIEEIETILNEKVSNLSNEKTTQLLDNLVNLKESVCYENALLIIAKAIDDYQTIVSTIGFDDLLRDLLRDSVGKIKAILSSDATSADTNNKVSTTGKVTNSNESEKSVKKESEQQKKTMRISEESLDVFLGYVGELIVVREMFEYLQKRLVSVNTDETIIEEFRRANDSFVELSHDLQAGIMAIRRLPLKIILQKVPRIIRDIATISGKEIDVKIEGEEIELDKSLIEALEAPIMHMVRNAADHGIETPDKRTGAGKSRTGTVNISGVEYSDNIEISIKDDGAGLNLEGIRKKCEQMGVIKPDQIISDDDLMKMIFLSGISTAEKVTDISGRGVGMDVAMQNVEKLGGKIAINNTPGNGVDFRITVPKNIGTQIINGFIIRVKDDHFILPLDTIVESFNATREDFTNIIGRGKCVSRRGTLIPFKNLNSVFEGSESDNDNSTVVTIHHKEELYGLGVDEILGLQQIVLKPVKGLSQEEHLFSGAAITGNGSVAMIIDMEKVLS